MHELQHPDEPSEKAPEPIEPPRASRPRWRRASLALLALVVAIISGALVTFFTVDLGPSLRQHAEREGSKFIQRPMHIGRLSAKITPGVFVVEDLVIEGLQPTDRPFLKAKKIEVVLPWWTIFRRELIVESVEMTDWDMLVETWPSSPAFPRGRHNFPKFTRESKSTGAKRFTTTLRSVLASRGTFAYEDHGTPWGIRSTGLRVLVTRGIADRVYRGAASFADSIITIQKYEPFHANMRSRFTMEGPQLRFSGIDLVSDGARSQLTGSIDFARWPEQTYQIRSTIDFPTQKNIYFHQYAFTAFGQGKFQGTFHLFSGGRELKGTFDSPMAGVNAWRFPDLHGSVLWVPDRLEVTKATSGLYGGSARFDYKLAPLNQRNLPARATWEVAYRDVDLPQLTDFLEVQGIRLGGRLTGRSHLEWELGRWRDKRGDGDFSVEPPAGVTVMTRALNADAVAQEAALPREVGPFNPHASLGYLPVGGHVAYALDPEWIALDASSIATPKTYVEFEGRTAYGEGSRIPFHVTSLDWLESDRVLAGIMTAFGAPTGAVPVGGSGQFDGVMLMSFRKPRIEGVFSGENMHAWDTVWGRGTAKVVIENSYVTITDSVISDGASEIKADGVFSLGYPRRDNGEEINARVFITKRRLADLRHAFELDEYPVEGLVSGEYHLYGKYETPFGFGRLVIDKGTAYGETFDTANASLRFEGSGVRLDAIDIRKSTGSVTGAAWVGWDGNYSFNADGTRIPVESLATVAFPRAPLSGLMQFTATGTGTFDVPRYDVRLRVDDLFAADEGIGQLTGRLSMRGELLTAELEAASPRLVMSGSGRIALTEQMDAELTLRFSNTSLDPYLRFFEPRLSPFTNAIAGGTIRVVGELADVDHLVVDGRVEQLDLKLFDYRVSNLDPGSQSYRPIELTLNHHVLDITQLRLFGEGTRLELSGNVNLHESTISVSASGDANLGILQGFYRDLRSSGAAILKATVNGPLSQPVFSGSAAISNGRVRQLSLPHSLESINGQVSFDAAGVRIDNVRARLAGGDVTFGGRVALNGFAPGELNLTATGQQMRIRYPEGFVSNIDADLALIGSPSSPLLRGTVMVRDALYSKRFEPNADLFSLTTGGGAALPGAASTTTVPVRFDVQIDAPSSLRVENNLARMVASADLQLRGTYDRPLLFGSAQIDRGDVIFEGNRYLVTRGTIGFANPARIEPYFDIEAETRVRVAGQTVAYRVTLGFTGTPARMSMNLNSDPPLSSVGILLLLLGQTSAQDLQNAELRMLNPTAASRSEEDLLKAATARFLAGSISAPVNRAVEQTLGVDLQITPSIGSSDTDPLMPSARMILGKRLSSRAYVTYARPLGTTPSATQILVLEYDQNDRLGWVLTQNGDRTFSIDFRVQHRR
ncbi:MAG TPA: translocation/assembly module TamB domain-containing protein [Vicinamibacterales bacterium]|nr:translocation/assembly module TamB domain-containing protein [Vicinamibacterales bacterium]